MFFGICAGTLRTALPSCTLDMMLGVGINSMPSLEHFLLLFLTDILLVLDFL